LSVKVFLSATFADFRDDRLEVIEAFRRLRTVEQLDVDIITMEDFGFSAANAMEQSLQLLEEADAYLGLLGFRYGTFYGDSRLSYTECEYRRACELGMPVFLLERTGMVGSADVETDPAKLAKLNRFKKDARLKHLVMGFANRSDLGKVISQYLPRRLRESFPMQRLNMRTEPATEAVRYFQLSARSSPLTKERPHAHEIDVMALSAVGFFRDRGTILDYLRQGCRIRVLILQKDGLAQQMVAAQMPQIRDDIDNAVARWRRISELGEAADLTGRLELRGMDWMPSGPLFLIDGRRPSAIAWIGMYTPDISSPSDSKWMNELTWSSGRDALSFYQDQFDTLWARARPFD
jgi:hypothetical protein